MGRLRHVSCCGLRRVRGWESCSSSSLLHLVLLLPLALLPLAQTGYQARNVSFIGDAYESVNYTLATNVNTLLPSYLAFSSFKQPVGRDRANTFTYMR